MFIYFFYHEFFSEKKNSWPILFSKKYQILRFWFYLFIIPGTRHTLYGVNEPSMDFLSSNKNRNMHQVSCIMQHASFNSAHMMSHDDKLEFPFAKFVRNFCDNERNFLLSLCYIFAQKNSTFCNHLQTSFRAKLRYSAFALFCFAQFCGANSQ